MITSKQVEKIRKALHDKVNEIHEQLDRQLDDLVRKFHEDKDVRRLMVDILHGKEGGVCGGCGETFQARNMELDHIVAKSSGGSYCIDNRQVLCGACNREKGKMPMAEFLKKKRRTFKQKDKHSDVRRERLGIRGIHRLGKQAQSNVSSRSSICL